MIIGDDIAVLADDDARSDLHLLGHLLPLLSPLPRIALGGDPEEELEWIEESLLSHADGLLRADIDDAIDRLLSHLYEVGWCGGHIGSG